MVEGVSVTDECVGEMCVKDVWKVCEYVPVCVCVSVVL